ncbi:hypothetical protein B9G69_001465 [Bdellovibrio sp. SKB1291214]|uniref:hypothetical protein n=1 Tax=Bdellovibrio sp. SKB1291214 TaxID=1732569 RepID=UPI000B51D91D|nr:hypothetical protein [Bdellovibrio sp. SKB1291214]UYL09243.1 hypothetical protein B9G69_001465 [Bdellovibrio sp. SKB1291214]
MKMAIHLIFFILAGIPAFAVQSGDILPSFKIQNQFEEPAELNAETKWIIFSSDMKAAKILTEYLNENAKNFDLSKTLIISDISKMPALVSKMFAIPKMKKYNFKLALDKEGDVTKAWPRQEGTILVIKVDQLKVESTENLTTAETVSSFFKEKFK